MAQGRQREDEAGAIGSPKYKNLKLRKERKKRRATVYGRVYVAPYWSRVAYGLSVQVPTAHR